MEENTPEKKKQDPEKRVQMITRSKYEENRMTH